MALQAVAEKRDGLLVPSANAAEAAVVEGLNVYPIGSLAEAVGFLSGQLHMDPESVDLDEVFAQHAHAEEEQQRGQAHAGGDERGEKAGRQQGAGHQDQVAVGQGAT